MSLILRLSCRRAYHIVAPPQHPVILEPMFLHYRHFVLGPSIPASTERARASLTHSPTLNGLYLQVAALIEAMPQLQAELYNTRCR